MRLVNPIHPLNHVVRTTGMAVVAGALAGLVVIACTDSSQKTITGPSNSALSGPRNSTIFGAGFANAGKVDVCVDGGAPAGTYTFKHVGFLSDYEIGVSDATPDGADGGNGQTVPNVPDNTNFTVPVGGCVTVETRTTPDHGFPGSAECPIFLDNWKPNFAYTTVPLRGVRDSNGHGQYVSVAGTSGGSEPAWNSTGGTTTDGGVTWQDQGLYPTSGPVGGHWCSGFPDTWSGITLQLVSAPGLYNHTDCFLDNGDLPAIPNSGSGTTPKFQCGTGNQTTRAYANHEHGAVIDYYFDVLPPPPQECTSLDTYYPYGTAPARTATVFNESGALSAWARSGNEIRAWYTDEHALTLGVDSSFINRKSPTPDIAAAYPIEKMGLFNPASATGNPIKTGSSIITGVLSSLDGAGRPLHPAMFVTDITGLTSASTKADSTAGDWQIAGGTGLSPNAIYGTWKGAIINVDSTKTPATKALTPRTDPTQNHKNVGAGGVNPPAAVADLGYSTEIVWDVTKIPGYDASHTYRLQFMVHDGDQNKTGGDVGQACLNVGPGTPTNFGPIIH